MTKAEFVESLANTLNQAKSESERVLEAVVDVLKQALQRGEKIDVRGLGVFKVRETKPRQARNPRTGEALSIPSKKAAVFKPERNSTLFGHHGPKGLSLKPSPAKHRRKPPGPRFR